jgi:hypothetical protein
MRQCVYPQCITEFEFNSNQKFCIAHGVVRAKESRIKTDHSRNRQRINYCRRCNRQVPKWCKIFCSIKCQKISTEKKRLKKSLILQIENLEKRLEIL